ncbi:MAG: hypothetical protein ABW252_18470 [Polyangiales bacterium]
MKLSPRQRSFILNEQILIPFVINFAFNAADVWLVFRHFAPIPMWTLPGVALDLISAIPGLPFLLCLITTPLVKRAVRKGKVDALPQGPEAYALLRRLPASNLWRSTWLGVAAQLAISPVLLGSFLLLGLDQLSLEAYIWLKGTLCGLLAAIVSPVATLYALAQVSGEPAPPRAAPEPAFEPVDVTPPA